MTALDNLPHVDSLFGLDLKTGAYIVAVIGIIHPSAYGCTLFIPTSYVLVTIWFLVALYFAASVALICGLGQNSALICTIWVWYTLIFVILMVMMMILLTLVFASRGYSNRIIIVFIGLLWYIILTFYFILVVNSYRKTIKDE